MSILNRHLVPKIQFLLRTADIFLLLSAGNAYSTTTPFAPIERTVDQTTAVGFSNRWQSSFRWDNVDFNSVLGEIYKKHQLYCLKLESVTFGVSSNASIFTATENNRFFNIFISGLNFYNDATEALLCSVRVPHGAQAHIFNYFNNELYFYMDNPTPQISIQYRDFLLNIAEPVGATNTHAFPHAQFVFSISQVN